MVGSACLLIPSSVDFRSQSLTYLLLRNHWYGCICHIVGVSNDQDLFLKAVSSRLRQKKKNISRRQFAQQLYSALILRPVAFLRFVVRQSHLQPTAVVELFSLHPRHFWCILKMTILITKSPHPFRLMVTHRQWDFADSIEPLYSDTSHYPTKQLQ